LNSFIFYAIWFSSASVREKGEKLIINTLTTFFSYHKISRGKQAAINIFRKMYLMLMALHSTQMTIEALFVI
jgi:hypothetical protein